jgi:hypothetical protein
MIFIYIFLDINETNINDLIDPSDNNEHKNEENFKKLFTIKGKMSSIAKHKCNYTIIKI